MDSLVEMLDGVVAEEAGQMPESPQEERTMVAFGDVVQLSKERSTRPRG